MSCNQTTVELTVDDLMKKVTELKKENYRLVQICSTKTEGYELTYSFDKDYDLLNLRLQIGEDTVVPSISEQYSYSFLYENEIKDLFGVKIQNINIDFDGNLYKLPIETPFKTQKQAPEKSH